MGSLLLCLDIEAKCMQAYDILDMEVDEDEAGRKKYGYKWRREPSHIANADLTAKAQHFSRVLDEALNTDRTVKEKWKEWRAGIETLTADQVGYYLCV